MINKLLQLGVCDIKATDHSYDLLFVRQQLETQWRTVFLRLYGKCKEYANKW